MEVATIPEAHIRNLTVVGSASFPSSCIGNSQVTGSGASAISATKVQQQRTYCYSQDRNNFNVADWKTTHIVHGAAGVIDTLKAKLPDKCTGADTVTVTWYLNGTSIGTCTFTTADANNAIKEVAPSSTALVAGDDISTRVTISGSAVGKGITAYSKVTEYGS
jgi:hypothetical protein